MLSSSSLPAAASTRNPAPLLDPMCKSSLYRALHGRHVAASHLKVTMLQVHPKLGSVFLCFAAPDIALLRQHQTANAQAFPVSPRQAAWVQQAGSHAVQRRRRRQLQAGRSSFAADLAESAAAAWCRNVTHSQH